MPVGVLYIVAGCAVWRDRLLCGAGAALQSRDQGPAQHSTAQHQQQQQLTGSQMVKSADTGPPSTTTVERFRDHCIQIFSSGS